MQKLHFNGSAVPPLLSRCVATPGGILGSYIVQVSWTFYKKTIELHNYRTGDNRLTYFAFLNVLQGLIILECITFAN